MDNAQFRLDFPEFASSVNFTESMLNFWNSIAVLQVSADRWGDLYTQGVSLFVAHTLSIQRNSIKTASAGGVAGNANGLATSKAVGAVSVSYYTSAAMMPNAGHWNLTIYGIQFVQLGRLLCTGAVQL